MRRDQGEPPRGSALMEATPTQLLIGQALGLPTERVVCLDCGALLGEGRAMAVYGYRVAERAQWDLRRCYCADCAVVAIERPTLGVTELLPGRGSAHLPSPETEPTNCV